MRACADAGLPTKNAYMSVLREAMSRDTLEPTGVAFAARSRSAEIARPRELQGRARLEAETHDVSLGQVDEGRADVDGPALHPALQGEARRFPK